MDQCLCVGDAEPLLAMNHYKNPNVYWNCFENLEFLIPPVGREDMMGKELETVVVTKVGSQGGSRDCARMCYGLSPHGSSCCGGGWGLPSSPGSTGQPAGPCPGHLTAWFWVVLFCFSGWKKKQKTVWPPSPTPHLPTWLTQILGDKPWTRRWREALDQLALKLKAARKIQCFLVSARSLCVVLRPIAPRGPHTITTAFSSKRDMYS